jgi:glycosyltransferase involved in cell wall biosynthesis
MSLDMQTTRPTSAIPCSVYIVTVNCGAWLATTLSSVQDFAEVVILDSGSTDDTYAIAARFANVRIQHQDWQGYAKQKAQALGLCTQEWALNLDGDEELSSPLKAEIIEFIHANSADALITPIRDTFMGKLASSMGRANAKIRFFRRSKGQYDLSHLVHEGIEVDGIVQPAQHAIYHYGDDDFSLKVDKDNQYSSLKAKEKSQKGKQSNLLRLVLVMPLIFIKSYLFRRNFLNGQRGFIGSMSNAYYAFLKEAKLYEQNQKQPKDQP